MIHQLTLLPLHQKRPGRWAWLQKWHQTACHDHEQELRCLTSPYEAWSRQSTCLPENHGFKTGNSHLSYIAVPLHARGHRSTGAQIWSPLVGHIWSIPWLCNEILSMNVISKICEKGSHIVRSSQAPTQLLQKKKTWRKSSWINCTVAWWDADICATCTIDRNVPLFSLRWLQKLEQRRSHTTAAEKNPLETQFSSLVRFY